MISVVHTDVSPDLLQVRVTTSVLSGKSDDGAAGAGRAAGERERRANDAIARQRTCAWLVRNTKSLRRYITPSPDG